MYLLQRHARLGYWQVIGYPLEPWATDDPELWGMSQVKVLIRESLSIDPAWAIER
jgi:hypothetical protein